MRPPPTTALRRRFADVESLIFLDFDGVTHPVSASPSEEDFLAGRCHSDIFCRSDILCELLNKRPGVALVATSAWRLACFLGGSLKIDEARFVRLLRPVMPPTLFARLVGTTPFLPKLMGRHDEIMLFVRQHCLESVPRVILDDHSAYFDNSIGADSELVVICDPERGVTLPQVQAIAEFLDQQPQIGKL